MRRIAVFVATTTGPVRIERITRERAPQSMVCLKRTSTILPISAAYDSFVRPGSGVIERSFGLLEPGAFRLDVGDSIDTGESWQLGVFIAHAIAANASAVQLGPAEDADTIVWATGCVDADLGVSAVNHIAEKLHASAPDIARWRAAGKVVTLCLPEGADYEATLAAGVPDGVRVVPLLTAREALDALDLTPPTAGPPAIVPPVIAASPARRIGTRLAVGFGAAVLAYLVVSEWIVSRHPIPAADTLPASAASAASPRPARASLPATPPSPTPVRLSLVERRAPEGRSCAEVQFGKATAVETAVVDATDASHLDGLCGVGLVVDAGAQPRFVAVTLAMESGALLYGTERPLALTGESAVTGRQEWAIDLPRRLAQPFAFQATAVSADHPTVADGSRDEGLTVATLRHQVLP